MITRSAVCFSASYFHIGDCIKLLIHDEENVLTGLFRDIHILRLRVKLVIVRRAPLGSDSLHSSAGVGSAGPVYFCHLLAAQQRILPLSAFPRAQQREAIAGIELAISGLQASVLSY